MKTFSITRQLIIASLVLLFACNGKDHPSAGLYSHGVIITNEGAFNQNNGTLTYYNPSNDSLINDVFMKVNNRPLGDVVQSFTAAGTLGFVAVNNSKKVEVVNLENMSSVGVMPASYPRYFIAVTDNKGYLTNNMFPGEVLVIDTKKLAVTDTITVGNEPEHLLQAGPYVFVANGGWGSDSTVSVIQASDDSVLKNIWVGDGPSNLVAGNDNSVWILCEGINAYSGKPETDSRLVKMDAVTFSILYSGVIGVKGDGFNPTLLAAGSNGSVFYVEADGVHKVIWTGSGITDDLLIPWPNSYTSSIYGLKVDPSNNRIFVLEAKGFVSAGMLHIYNADGSLYRSFNVGIAPNGACVY